uniref:Lcl C-terminal domain-containing protein n=2 Tax=Flavobacterium sp. TaxID=239 RepID=UPI00404837EF
MKKIITICAVLLMTASVFAQAPEKMSYQAVVRDGSNALVTSTAVGMQISILQYSASGTAVYVETQTPTSNINGLVSLEIGSGTVVSGDFTTIDWANGPYFIKTETDPTGGTSYTITGTSQLLSVPYALHAKTAETVTGTITETDPVFGASVASGITGTDTTNWNNKQDQLVAGSNISIVGNTISATGGSSNDFYLGQDTLGGIVFYIYIGSDGNQHGLIVNKNESTAQWQSSGTTTYATRSWDGVYNTGLMTSSPASTYVNGLTDGGFTDWYLPSIDELSILWHNRFHANNALNAGGFTLLSNTAYYWSSTEYSAPNAFIFIFTNGNADYFVDKANTFSVRAVRAF